MVSASQAGAGILIVEDDFDVRDMLSLVLQNEGYSVATAANGREAIEYLRGGAAPCLILLDLMMPVMNGWEFRTVQQQDPSLSPIPVVVLSADGRIQEKAASIDAASYLKKPIEFDLLLDTIKHYC